MAKNYVQEGDVLNYTNAGGAAIASGALVIIGKRVGIALGTIAPGASGSLAATGVFTLPKLGTDAIGEGDLLYWDSANSRLTATAGGNVQAGYATDPSANGVAVVNIKINA
jgi:predicted RecA/RadA family phage recombinase